MKVRAVRTPIFEEGDDLITFILEQVPTLKEGSILAVTSKVIALSERRVADVSAKEKLIKRESTWAMRIQKKWWWTEKEEQLLVNAGIDESNADGKLILLSRDSFATARKLRFSLLQNYKIRKLGVVVTDSRISPMRKGVTGLALGYAGFRGIRDYRGKKDLFGRPLKVTVTDVADSLATAATLVMGEGAERQPLAIIEGAPVEFEAKVDRREVLISAKDDMYAPLFRRVARRRKRHRE